jgi:predicted MPP superfamily phosphohydrolase
VPDTHSPYHDKKAWALMMKAAKEFKPDTIAHMGDLGDFYAVSSHSKDPKRIRHLKDEIIEVRKLRQELDDLKPKRKIFIEGNHENRLERYLQDKAPELFGLVSSDDLLELSENNWEYIPYRESAKIGKLYITHDTGASGKYTTMRALETFQHSVVIAHHHQFQYMILGDATGEYCVGAQFGWLGDSSKVDYMQQVKVAATWALGFGVGYHDTKTGIVYLVPCPIVDYTVCVEGKIYKV